MLEASNGAVQLTQKLDHEAQLPSTVTRGKCHQGAGSKERNLGDPRIASGFHHVDDTLTQTIVDGVSRLDSASVCFNLIFEEVRRYYSLSLIHI